MAFHSLETPTSSSSRIETVLHGVSGLGHRALASWRRHQAERALEGLSFDTLKDIGFPSADDLGKNDATAMDTPAR
ncbi:hypothetical protein QO002_002846 [Pararhizobium capsulatum DSM 1112]|uniref:DUF1127 domain-containing protein n=1 Tax=Pararhizobium capsulatum DSM 1112 TaxID=1121113 RepID=A0ABU0BRX4_9HYPH|nr:hypothetical protein [Pararhizobium capsulatum]MDQ0320708.1 hypothetical protein [Pararhizobium capsulatum DSM 1112]